MRTYKEDLNGVDDRCGAVGRCHSAWRHRARLSAQVLVLQVVGKLGVHGFFLLELGLLALLGRRRGRLLGRRLGRRLGRCLGGNRRRIVTILGLLQPDAVQLHAWNCKRCKQAELELLVDGLHRKVSLHRAARLRACALVHVVRALVRGLAPRPVA